MSKVETYRELLSRVEGATGADRELDEAITVALLDSRLPVAARRLSPAQPYTASIDAALALVERVLPGWFPNIGQDERPGCGHQWCATVATTGARKTARGWAKTPALALLSAILRALIQGAEA